MEQEVWRDVVGYEGLYQVSNTGKVYSLISQKLLTPIKHSRGYLRVHLYGVGGKKTCYIHILVANAFIEKPDNENRYVVNHKDEDPTNNNVGNLEWVTHKQNIEYSRNLHEEEWREKYRLGHRVAEPIIAFDNGKILHIYKTVQAAADELHFDYGTVRRRLRDPDLKTHVRPNIRFKFLNNYLAELRELHDNKNNNI